MRNRDEERENRQIQNDSASYAALQHLLQHEFLHVYAKKNLHKKTKYKILQFFVLIRKKCLMQADWVWKMEHAHHFFTHTFDLKFIKTEKRNENKCRRRQKARQTGAVRERKIKFINGSHVDHIISSKTHFF